MADRLAYIKFFFENRIAIIGIIVSLGGYNGFQFWEKSEKDTDILNMQNQITELAIMTQKPVVVQHKADNWGKYTNLLNSKLKSHRQKYHGESE